MPDPVSEAVSSRVLTVPNLLSMLRLVGVPVFLWLILTSRDGAALVILVVSGATDYLDGKIARRFGSVSRLGQLLDPVADRLYILATLAGLAWRDIVPLWLALVIVMRDVLLTLPLWLLKRRGQMGLPVHFVGKAATFNLLYAFPLLLIAEIHPSVAAAATTIGWAFAWWGVGLYLWGAVLYLRQGATVLRAARGRRVAS